jgi:hypothetical protein
VATTKLALWNGALVELGIERLSDTGDPVKPARELTAVYSQVVGECVASGSWNFAMADASITGDTGIITAPIGYRYGFTKPTDWVRTIAVSLDEFFSAPLLQYYDDAGIWKADSTPLYVRYVSNDTGVALNPTQWTAHFARFVSLELADRVCMILTQNATLKEKIEALRDKARKTAKNIDSMDEAQPKFPPPNSWTAARWGRLGRGDRGSRGSLTG